MQQDMGKWNLNTHGTLLILRPEYFPFLLLFLPTASTGLAISHHGDLWARWVGTLKQVIPKGVHMFYIIIGVNIFCYGIIK